MAHKQSGELKKRAWLAKQRLKMGYFDSQGGQRAFGAISAGISEPTRSSADERMYQKVCAILDRDEATINPIGQLIDGEVYNNLDPSARQRYILELSNKFRELKERYYREKTGA